MKILLNRWMLLPSILFLLISCEKDKRESSPIIEEEINLADFTRVYAGERFNVTITKGEEFQVIVRGPANDVHDMEFTVSNSILDIQYATYIQKRPRIDIMITMPDLMTVALTGAASATVNGFQDAPHVVRAVLSGAAKCTLNGTGLSTQIDISGGSELSITGVTGKLVGNISGAGKLNAYGLSSTEVDIAASGGSVAYVKVQDILFAAASGGSKIYYKGNPATKAIETSGGGQVIQE